MLPRSYLNKDNLYMFPNAPAPTTYISVWRNSHAARYAIPHRPVDSTTHCRLFSVDTDIDVPHASLLGKAILAAFQNKDHIPLLLLALLNTPTSNLRTHTLKLLKV